ncbi:MAG: transposase [Clostridia bacterium]|nr:transposase [Clostridia bacterium]
MLEHILARVPKHAQAWVVTLVRTIFAQPDQAAARQQLERVAADLAHRFPQAASLLREAEDGVPATWPFRRNTGDAFTSTNMPERVNRELARRCDVVGIFPNVVSVLRLLGALLEEQQDEWRVERRYFSQESMAKLKALDRPRAPGSDSASSMAAMAMFRT